MRKDTSFAPPISELHRGFQHPDVATLPTAGKGFAVNPQGHVPTGTKAGEWTWEFVEVSVNLGDLASQTGTSTEVSISGLQVGDLCFYLGQTGTDQNARINTVRDVVCATAGTITLQTFNADNASNNPGASDMQFLVVHRFITQ